MYSTDLMMLNLKLGMGVTVEELFLVGFTVSQMDYVALKGRLKISKWVFY
jgi:hypothetical protein